MSSREQRNAEIGALYRRQLEKMEQRDAEQALVDALIKGIGAMLTDDNPDVQLEWQSNTHAHQMRARLILGDQSRWILITYSDGSYERPEGRVTQALSPTDLLKPESYIRPFIEAITDMRYRNLFI